MIDTKKSISDNLFSNFINLIQKQLQNETQGSLARKLNCKQSSISRWLSGERKPNFEHLLRAYKEIGGFEVSEILEEILGEKRAATIIAICDDDPELFESLIQILQDKDSEDYMTFRNLIIRWHKKTHNQ